MGFVCPHQFEFVSAGHTEEENGGQNKQLQSDRLDAEKYILYIGIFNNNDIDYNIGDDLDSDADIGLEHQ